MSARSFRSVFMVASCAGAALGCYLVSLRVASERAALSEVETQIAMTERDIRLLQTEIGTRGRLAQLERWNVRVLALSAPTADQFVDGGFALARLIRPEPKIDIQAPIVLASASTNNSGPQVEPDLSQSSEEQRTPEDLLHVASLNRLVGDEPSAGSSQGTGKKVGDKAQQSAPRPVTRPVRTASADPLAPLPESSSKSRKDSGSAQ